MISEAVDRAVKAKWRDDLVNMLTDAGRTLAGTGLQVNGVRYQGVLLGPLLMKAAAALEECWKREGLIQDAAKPENPDDVVVKVTVPDRWPMTEAGQRRAAQEAAAPKPMTNGDRIRAMTDEELIAAFGGRICDVIPAEDCPGTDHTCCHSCLIKWLGSPEKEAAPEPVTNGDRIQDRKDGELEKRERLECLLRKTKTIADRRKWNEPWLTIADICGQEAKDGQ